MPTATRDSMGRDLDRLQQAVGEAAEESPSALAAISSVLRLASEAVEAIRSRATSGAYEVQLTEEQRRRYFPPMDWVGRTVTPAEMDEANARWEAALQRGRDHRAEALEELGPVLTPRQVAERLGVSTVTVNNWRRKGKLLAVRFDNHQHLYPLFQFADSPDRGESGVLRHLDAVLAALGGKSDWWKATFFLDEAPFLGGRTPLAMLRAGGQKNLDRILTLAQHTGEMGW